MYPQMAQLVGILLDRLFREQVKEDALRIGIPHPLAKFALSGCIHHGGESEVFLDALVALAGGKDGEKVGPWTPQNAAWLLFESKDLYRYLCQRIGIDGERFRNYLMGLKEADDLNAFLPISTEN